MFLIVTTKQGDHDAVILERKARLLFDHQTRSEGESGGQHTPPLLRNDQYVVSMDQLLRQYPAYIVMNRILVDVVRLRVLKAEGVDTVLRRCFLFDKKEQRGWLKESCERLEHVPTLLWYMMKNGWSVNEAEVAPIISIVKPVVSGNRKTNGVTH